MGGSAGLARAGGQFRSPAPRPRSGGRTSRPSVRFPVRGDHGCRHDRHMTDAAELLERVRVSSGLTQEELARRAGTSRPTLSAYEHGRKSPTVATFARLLSRAGWELDAQPHVSFTRQTTAHGKPVWVPANGAARRRLDNY